LYLIVFCRIQLHLTICPHIAGSEICEDFKTQTGTTQLPIQFHIILGQSAQ
jgi:hypothetical protein